MTQSTLITISALQAHINRMNAGRLDFSQVELNSRADLVRFKGYSVADAVSMDEGRIYDILEGNVNSSEGSHLVTECKCKACDSFLIETDYSDYDDCYTLFCKKCNAELRLHYTAYDAWRESIHDAKAFELNACKVVKLLSKYCYVSVNNSKQFMEQIRANGKHIQTLETSYDTNEYYAMSGNYYFISDTNSGEFKPLSDKDFMSFVSEMGA